MKILLSHQPLPVGRGGLDLRICISNKLLRSILWYYWYKDTLSSNDLEDLKNKMEHLNYVK